MSTWPSDYVFCNFVISRNLEIQDPKKNNELICGSWMQILYSLFFRNHWLHQAMNSINTISTTIKFECKSLSLKCNILQSKEWWNDSAFETINYCVLSRKLVLSRSGWEVEARIDPFQFLASNWQSHYFSFKRFFFNN